uniref:Secreted protein n=1 Tax=Paramormyrops kingsleyae TaxID=1676925 RepID=A0A3B3RYG7_9TELE
MICLLPMTALNSLRSCMRLLRTLAMCLRCCLLSPCIWDSSSSRACRWPELLAGFDVRSFISPWRMRFKSVSNIWIVSFCDLLLSFSLSNFFFHSSAVSSKFTDAVFLMVFALSSGRERELVQEQGWYVGVVRRLYGCTVRS